MPDSTDNRGTRRNQQPSLPRTGNNRSGPVDGTISTKSDADKIVDRIRAEGQLTRNTGTNSIKGTNIRLDKLADIFSSMKSAMSIQTAILRETLNLKVEEMERVRRMEDLGRVSPNHVEPPTIEFGGGRSGRNGWSSGEDSTSHMWPFSAGLLGGLNLKNIALGGGLLAIGAALGSVLLRGGVMTLIAPAVAEFLGEVVEESLKQAGIPANVAEGFKDEVSRGVIWAAVGYAILGRRGAIIGAVAAMVSSLVSRTLDYAGLEDWKDKDISFFGITLTGEHLTNIVSGIGVAVLAFLPGLLKIAGRFLARIFMGPLGLALLVGELTFQAGKMFNDWLTERRGEVMKEINERLEEGLITLRSIAEDGKELGLLRRWQLSSGIWGPQTTTEEAYVAAQRVSTPEEAANLHQQLTTDSSDMSYQGAAIVHDLAQKTGDADLIEDAEWRLKQVQLQTDFKGLEREVMRLNDEKKYYIDRMNDESLSDSVRNVARQQAERLIREINRHEETMNGIRSQLYSEPETLRIYMGPPQDESDLENYHPDWKNIPLQNQSLDSSQGRLEKLNQAAIHQIANYVFVHAPTSNMPVSVVQDGNKTVISNQTMTNLVAGDFAGGLGGYAS